MPVLLVWHETCSNSMQRMKSVYMIQNIEYSSARPRAGESGGCLVAFKAEVLLLLLSALSLFVFTGCYSDYGPNSPDFYPRNNPPFNYGKPLSSLHESGVYPGCEISNLDCSQIKEQSEKAAAIQVSGNGVDSEHSL